MREIFSPPLSLSLLSRLTEEKLHHSFAFSRRSSILEQQFTIFKNKNPMSSVWFVRLLLFIAIALAIAHAYPSGMNKHKWVKSNE